MTISDFLPEGHQSIYGTGITAERFETISSGNSQGWGVRGLTEDGEQGDYFIVLAAEGEPGNNPDGSRMATCTVDIGGERREVQHPYARRIGGLASVADWYDAIAIEDAKGRKSEHTGPWGGQDLEGALTRMEHNIVAYGKDEVAVESFSSAAEVSKWLDDALAKTQVRAEVWLVRNAFESDRIADQTMLRGFSNDDVDGWAPIPFSTNYVAKDWLEHFFRNESFSPYVHVRMLGAQRESLDADYALSWSELTESGELTRDEVRLDGGSDDWLVIRVLDTDVALPVPWPGANIVVHHDEDGAQVGIDVMVTEKQDERNRKYRAWESEWGRFLDERVTLADAEIAEGINRAEGDLQALIEEEQ